ncbi:MAG TPA: hypothetical protein VMF31_09980 [Solirubrobacterales bacterium]|nr:hypothetical protein [Solirubrobacterales bacterium]
MKTACAVAMAVGALLGLSASAATAATGIPSREADPVVLTGVQTPSLIGAAPERIVAFSWDGSWKQIPVQVDERKVADYRVIRRWGPGSTQFMAEVYADPKTWTGADGEPQRPANDPVDGAPIPGTTGDPDLDGNDEIAMMAADSGTSAAGRSNPAGVEGATRTPVRIEDPLGTGAERFIYLFESKGDLDPSAGKDYVSYGWTFSPPLTGGYLLGYDYSSIGDDANGPPVNPEASSVKTDLYEQTFPGRWMIDGLKVKAGTSTGVDILDGDKSTIGQSGCGRNELTFSRGGGGFVAAIDGPVRAIRSYIGANSGSYTQRDQIYYRGRMDNNTYLRVHQGITDFIMAMDYSEAAFGMTYRNSLNEIGATIDGGGGSEGLDGLAGPLMWEQTTGAQGSVTSVARIVSDVPNMTFTSYYQDNMSPPSGNNAITCSGDDHAIGASGPRIKMQGSGFNTDPVLPPTPPSTKVNSFTGHRYTYYGAPGETVDTAKLRSRQVDSPLTVATGAAVDPNEEVPTPGGPDGPGTGKPGRQNWVGLKVKVSPPSLTSRIGKTKRIKVTVQNIGDLLAKRVRICPVANDSMVKSSGCQNVKKLKPGHRARRYFRVRLRSAAAGKSEVTMKFRAKATKSKARTGKLTIRPAGR